MVLCGTLQKAAMSPAGRPCGCAATSLRKAFSRVGCAKAAKAACDFLASICRDIWTRYDGAMTPARDSAPGVENDGTAVYRAEKLALFIFCSFAVEPNALMVRPCPNSRPTKTMPSKPFPTG